MSRRRRGGRARAEARERAVRAGGCLQPLGQEIGDARRRQDEPDEERRVAFHLLADFSQVGFDVD